MQIHIRLDRGSPPGSGAPPLAEAGFFSLRGYVSNCPDCPLVANRDRWPRGNASFCVAPSPCAFGRTRRSTPIWSFRTRAHQDSRKVCEPAPSSMRRAPSSVRAATALPSTMTLGWTPAGGVMRTDCAGPLASPRASWSPTSRLTEPVPRRVQSRAEARVPLTRTSRVPPRDTRIRPTSASNATSSL